MTIPVKSLGTIYEGYNTREPKYSLAFDGTSQYLTRTPAVAGDRTKWTFSCWLKKSSDGDAKNHIFVAGSSTTPGGLLTGIYFNNDVIAAAWNSASSVSLSTSTFRDPTAWYHVVAVARLTSLDVYVNGTLVVQKTHSSGLAAEINNTSEHRIGCQINLDQFYFNGAMTDVYFLDGTIAEATEFGYQDELTGSWKRRAYSGSGLSTGVNSFYLPFNNSSESLASQVTSHTNSVTWTPVNFSRASYWSDCIISDHPENNHCTLNVSDLGSHPVGGAGTYMPLFSTASGKSGTFGITSGKWYWEVYIEDVASGDGGIGIITENRSPNLPTPNVTGSAYMELSTGKYSDQTDTTGNTYYIDPGSWQVGDTIKVAFDADSGKIWFGLTGTWDFWHQTTNNYPNPIAGTYPVFSGISMEFPWFPFVKTQNAKYYINFGQRPFLVTPPDGFRALCTRNLPTTEIRNPNEAVGVLTFTSSVSSTTQVRKSGDSTKHLPTSIAITKRRDGTEGWKIVDSSNPGYYWGSEDNGGQTSTTLSLVNGGFDYPATAGAYSYLGAVLSQSNRYGISVQPFTVSGATTNVVHSLGTTPEMIIVAYLGSGGTQNPRVYHRYMSGTANTTPTSNLHLNTTNTYAGDPSSSVRISSVDSSQFVFTGGYTGSYVAYLFSGVSGLSRFGMYTSTNASDGPSILVGFKPKLLLLKGASIAGPWVLIDSTRSSNNVSTANLQMNSNIAESATNGVDFLANGFKIRNTTNINSTAGNTYVYAAFADAPFGDIYTAPSNSV
jgi:hypothetical protein